MAAFLSVARRAVVLIVAVVLSVVAAFPVSASAAVSDNASVVGTGVVAVNLVGRDGVGAVAGVAADQGRGIGLDSCEVAPGDVATAPWVLAHAYSPHGVPPAGVAGLVGEGLFGSMFAGGAGAFTQSGLDQLLTTGHIDVRRLAFDTVIGAGTAGLLHGAARGVSVLREAGSARALRSAIDDELPALTSAERAPTPGPATPEVQAPRATPEPSTPAVVDDVVSPAATSATGGGAPGHQTTILGENMADRVMPFAERTNARTLGFGTSSEDWARMTPQQRYKLNDGQLRARINEGDDFRYIGQDPARPPDVRARFDLTRSEILRLQERGIPYETVAPEEVAKILGQAP